MANPQQPGQLAPTAGPISAALGAGGNFTSGLSAVPTPKFKQQAGALNPTSILNSVQGYQNQANTANAQRYGQALGVMGGAQDSANAYLNQAKTDVANVGQQAYGRINEQLQNREGGVSQDLVNRGLYNTTLAETMQHLPLREAEDARQGVDQYVAQLNSGLDSQHANSQHQFGLEDSSLIASRNDQAPDLGAYAGLMQSAAAGNFGNFPRRTGSVTSYPSPSAPASPSFGGGGSGGSGGYLTGSTATGAFGGAGQGGGYSGGMGAGAISSALGPPPTGGSDGSGMGAGGYGFMANGSTLGNVPTMDQASPNMQSNPNGSLSVNNGLDASQQGSISITPTGAAPAPTDNQMPPQGTVYNGTGLMKLPGSNSWGPVPQWMLQGNG